MMSGVFIVGSKRSPIGKLGGSLASLSASDICGQVICALLQETEISADKIDEVIIGQVLTGGAGQNPARQSAIYGGIPISVPAFTINMVCGAGQKSLHLAAQAIKSGEADLVLTGGQDSMTNAPHFIPLSNERNPLNDLTLKPSVISDGLWDIFNDVHMGTTVEAIAKRFNISREEQDIFAHESQLKANIACRESRFTPELVSIITKHKKGPRKFTTDEHPYLTSLEKLASLRPAFNKNGTITAGNASGLNDGAAAIIIASERAIKNYNLSPIARIVSYASFALDPMDMGLGPVGATRQALQKANWNIQDIDLAEINEAYAAQSIAVIRELNIDPEKVNVNGGAIALGHPLAASGSRIVVTLLYEMQRRRARKGFSTLCVGGGMGVAICIEM